jgi:chromosomal replication initiator protein
MDDFRSRYRHGCDLLLLDDIQFLAGREQTQEEFFHTFNALTQSGRQVVLSCDAAPNQIPDLEERLTSRFNSGLVAEIQKPSFETRVAILKTKAALRQIALPDDVADYLAARIDTNIRELEGAITKMQGLAAINGCPMSLDLAKEAVAPGLGREGAPLLTIQEIAEAVTLYYDVRLSEILSKRRHKSITLPRQVCMWLARRHTRFSLQEIGGSFGGRDHTTVMHAIAAVNAKRQRDPVIDHDVESIEVQLLERKTGART